jgi:choline-sulfatase
MVAIIKQKGGILMDRPDILVFISDQHAGRYGGFAGDQLVRTPNLDRIAANGTAFDAAYTSCPLCVPARVSMLTGQLPSKTGIYTNHGAIASDQATFLHAIAAEGYETVLCGRMHFVGDDQRHGFTKRIMGDFTPLYWGRGSLRRLDLGRFKGTTDEKGCLKLVGKGNSPVLEYDRAVISAALEYLQADHEKPQCVVVGTYAPHCPLVAPPELFDYYREHVALPVTVKNELNYRHSVLVHREQNAAAELVLNARAAYFGMITNLDRQIGAVREAWREYLQRNNRKGVFVYLSDHGEQVGERKMYGKQTFFENSAQIPLMFEGDGIKANHRVAGAVSIMDMGPTLCEMAGAALLPEQDGKSLVKQVFAGADELDRYVYSEFIEQDVAGRFIPGRMVRQGNWKLISYHAHEDEDLLFDIVNDPDELCNIAGQFPDQAAKLKTLLTKEWNISQIIKTHQRKLANVPILTKWGQNSGVTEAERYSFTGVEF